MTQHSIVCVLLLMTLLGVVRPAAAACLFNVDVLKYQQYLPKNLCPNDNEDGCLQPTSYIATRSDGRQVRVRGVYRWYHENAIWEDADHVSRVHLLPHFILEYMRLLRDAYSACPDLYRTQLFNQIDYVVSQGVMRNFPDSVIPALVWENRYGITQGMEQAEMANFFAATARKYSRHGAPEAHGTMRYALHAIQSLFIPVGVRTGGVRSIVTTPCGAKRARLRPCFWFHSRGVGIDTDAVENPEDKRKIE